MGSLHERVSDLEEQANAHGSDLAMVRHDIAELRTDLSAIRGEMATRADLSAIRGEMTDLRRDMNQRFLAIDQKFTWLLGTQTAVLVAIIGALVGSFYR